MTVAYRQHLYLACFCCHFVLILAACTRDTLWIIARGYTFLPDALRSYSQKAERVVSTVLGESVSPSNPVRQTLTVYRHLGGIESGYGFFAPNVPDNYKLVFEVHYADGRIEYELPRVASTGAGLRLSTLLDNIGDAHYDPLRELMIKMVAYSVWREHPQATMIRAVFGFAVLPTARQYGLGKRETYEFLYAYDFRSSPLTAPPEAR